MNDPNYLESDKPINIDRLLTLLTAIKEKKPIEWRPREKPDAWCEAPTPPSRRLLNILINNPECFRVGREVREVRLAWMIVESRWVSVGDDYTGATIRFREVL